MKRNIVLDDYHVTLAKQLAKIYCCDNDYYSYHIKPLIKLVKVCYADDKEIIITSYLHNILKKVSVNIIEDLFGNIIAEALMSITQHPEDSTEDFLKICSNNNISKIVMIHIELLKLNNDYLTNDESSFDDHINIINNMKYQARK